MNDTHAEAACLALGIGGDATGTPAATTAASTTTTTTSTAATTTTTAAATPAAAFRRRAEVGGAARDVGRQSEAHVGVTGAGELRLAQYDVGHALELGLEHSALGRKRDDLGDDIMRVQRERCTGSGAFDEITT